MNLYSEVLVKIESHYCPRPTGASSWPAARKA